MSLEVKIVEIIDPRIKLKDGNRVYTSLEGENPSGSIKDRLVYGELNEIVTKSNFSCFSGIGEVSSGSTALSLAYHCRKLNLRCVLFLPNTVSPDIVGKLRGAGVEMHFSEMNLIYNDFDKFLMTNPKIYNFNQLYDRSKKRHYHLFGKEVSAILGKIDAVLGAVGTGHSLIGTAEGMPGVKVFSIEPVGNFKVPGVRNLLLDRFGERDKCSALDFDGRLEISLNECIGFNQVKTSEGLVDISPSFAIVLAGVEKFLSGCSNSKVFAIGSSVKKIACVNYEAA